METAAEGAGWLSRFARSCGSWVGVEAGHVRVVCAARRCRPLVSPPWSVVHAGLVGTRFLSAALAHCTDHSTSRSVSAFSDVTRRNYRVPV